ncbi:restriction endonuclease [Cytobacillus oceanisediminis]|uniref:restriction endonuclease n=1 Tax=Cytobacillus oceanisediminis TaxID=665099 RepID=UPI001C250D55|nr:restriction endonuclease [Cytobacillus oceanisediminis]MBU8729144.1 restriction endonuclease [Cytobacillus oceanisediminis]
MLFEEKDIDFSLIDGTTFENLCYELLENNNFFNLKWLQGSGDRGRDIEAEIHVSYDLVGLQSEVWHFECKNHSKGIGAAEIHDKIGWAFVNKPDKLIFLVSTYLTPDAKDYVNKAKEQFKSIYFIEGIELKKILLSKPILVEKYFINEKRKLLINSIRDFSATGVIADKHRLEIILSDEHICESYELHELLFLLLCSTFSNSLSSDKWTVILDYIVKNSTDSNESLIEGYSAMKESIGGGGLVFKQTPSLIQQESQEGLSEEERQLKGPLNSQIAHTAFFFSRYFDKNIKFLQIELEDNKFLEVLIENDDVQTFKTNITSRDYYPLFI